MKKKAIFAQPDGAEGAGPATARVATAEEADRTAKRIHDLSDRIRAAVPPNLGSEACVAVIRDSERLGTLGDTLEGFGDLLVRYANADTLALALIGGYKLYRVLGPSIADLIGDERKASDKIKKCSHLVDAAESAGMTDGEIRTVFERCGPADFSECLSAGTDMFASDPGKSIACRALEAVRVMPLDHPTAKNVILGCRELMKTDGTKVLPYLDLVNRSLSVGLTREVVSIAYGSYDDGCRSGYASGEKIGKAAGKEEGYLDGHRDGYRKGFDEAERRYNRDYDIDRDPTR